MTEKRDVIETEVPDAGVDHSVRAEGHESTDNGPGENVIPVVVFVDGKGSTDEAGPKNGCVESDDLPHSRVVVGKDLQLGVKVQVQEHEASKSCSSMTRWHRLETVVDFTLVARANAAVEHDLSEAIGDVPARCTSVVAIIVGTDRGEDISWDDGLASCEEVGTETANEPLDEDLEDGGGDKSVEKSDGSVVDVPEATGADL
jgi:hypothetical protein